MNQRVYLYTVHHDVVAKPPFQMEAIGFKDCDVVVSHGKRLGTQTEEIQVVEGQDLDQPQKYTETVGVLDWFGRDFWIQQKGKLGAAVAPGDVYKSAVANWLTFFKER